MNVETKMKLRVELQPDDPVMMDIMNISKHDNVSEQEVLTRSLKIFYPEVALRIKPCEKKLLKRGLDKEGLTEGVKKGNKI